MPINHPTEAQAQAIVNDAQANAATAAAEYAARNAATPPPPRLGTPDTMLVEPSSISSAVNTAKQPGLSRSEVKAARDSLLAAGVPADQINAAIEADGVTDLPPALSDREKAAFTRLGLPMQPNATDYRGANLGELGRGLPPERIANIQKETGELSAALGLPASVGVSLTEHLAQLATQFKAPNFDPAAWHAEQERVGIKLTGSKEGYDKMVSEAKALLGELAPDNALAKALAGSAQMNSWYFASMMALHRATLAQFAASYPEISRTPGKTRRG